MYDPSTAYPDPNVQAWAQYYAQGGKDPTGSVYFISVPGVKEPPPQTPGSATHPGPQSEGGYNPYAQLSGQHSSTDLTGSGYAGQQHLNGSQTSLGTPSPYQTAPASATDLNGPQPGPGESQLGRHPSIASTVVPHNAPHSPSAVGTFSQQQENIRVGSPLAQSFHQQGDGVGASAPPGQDQHHVGGYMNGVDPYSPSAAAPAPVPKSPGVGGNESGWPGYGGAPGLASQFNAMHIAPRESAPAPAQ
ncbi:hypothetical protein GLOTRDRAFT_115818 [Gloeophyllum trabeum ATCC 11539]|uniref:Uncharacterized protein n=1 Tax=Gloeophyllum trabeum (strain ATCC 11539 / FP-39264 / Madison 617) TaxID=670483 RepID=S7RU03_GLOTA|nr:uncharacterized protein GLOTRDRAFT_115818 [Gloeophyllum trabeum ATCC 11539]EPQ56644.1 hypothetical protein GLOTRDRAFT_115818 [Gloeophyllum trabeum ATCC 11539]